MAKFVLVTGGVVSGLGKGITAASLGRLSPDPGRILIGLPGVVVVKGECPARGEEIPEHRGEQIGGQDAQLFHC